MKLRNKKTGEIIDLNKGSITDVGFGASIQLQATDRYNKPIWNYKSLAELNAEWEDYEEPKELYWANYDGSISHAEEGTMSFIKQKQIGNYFDTKEEAEKAVEKLKAWKRLKDKGLGFTDDLVYGEYYGCGSIRFIISPPIKAKYVMDDLKLLFGGEE